MRIGRFVVPLQAICLLGTLVFSSSCGTTGERNDPKTKIGPRLPENEIRNLVLKYTSIGSSREEVWEFVQVRLKHTGDSSEDGPAMRRRWPGRDEGVGVRSVNICLGTYGFPGRTGTFVS